MILIQCVESKQNKPTKAKNMYQGNLFNAMKRYCEAKGEDYRILSAKHGLLHPETIIDAYDAFGLSKEQCEVIAEQLDENDVQNVEVIGGKDYVNSLTPELERFGIDVTETCRGMKIGKRVQHLQQKCRELENHTLL